MAKPIPTHQYQAILDVIGQFPSGANIEQIEAALEKFPNGHGLCAAPRFLAAASLQLR